MARHSNEGRTSRQSERGLSRQYYREQLICIFPRRVLMKAIVSKLFDTYDQAQRAVRDLEDGGVSHNDISIVASNADGRVRVESSDRGKGVGATAGAVAGGAVGLLTGLGLMAIPGVGPVVAAGWLAAAGAGAL